MIYSFYIVHNVRRHIVKIGLTTNIKRREAELKASEKLTLLAYKGEEMTLVEALLVESLLRFTVWKKGLKHYALDHFSSTPAQHKDITTEAKVILNLVFDIYHKLHDII